MASNNNYNNPMQRSLRNPLSSTNNPNNPSNPSNPNNPRPSSKRNSSFRKSNNPNSTGPGRSGGGIGTQQFKGTSRNLSHVSAPRGYTVGSTGRLSSNQYTYNRIGFKPLGSTSSASAHMGY